MDRTPNGYYQDFAHACRLSRYERKTIKDGIPFIRIWEHFFNSRAPYKTTLNFETFYVSHKVRERLNDYDWINNGKLIMLEHLEYQFFVVRVDLMSIMKYVSTRDVTFKDRYRYRELAMTYCYYLNEEIKKIAKHKARPRWDFNSYRFPYDAKEIALEILKTNATYLQVKARQQLKTEKQ